MKLWNSLIYEAEVNAVMWPSPSVSTKEVVLTQDGGGYLLLDQTYRKCNCKLIQGAPESLNRLSFWFFNCFSCAPIPMPPCLFPISTMASAWRLVEVFTGELLKNPQTFFFSVMGNPDYHLKSGQFKKQLKHI